MAKHARWIGLLLVVASLWLNGCSQPEAPLPTRVIPTSTFGEGGVTGEGETAVARTEPLEFDPSEVEPGTFRILVDTNANVHPISPLIYGISRTEDEYLELLRPGVVSWGGNANTRYNWKIGNAWNTARDWFYLNTNYGVPDGVRVSDNAFASANAYGAEIRVALPTLGWVAKSNSESDCSFPEPDGTCGNANLASCLEPGPVADPTLANLKVDVSFTTEWVEHMVAEGFDVRFLAMDNEPDLWGITHYDVHPECTTYAEILEQYLTYAAAVRPIVPEAELLGPVSCCWQYYFNSPAGAFDKLSHGNQGFLPWFLTKVREHDADVGVRHLDVLDIHYYPEGVFNSEIDPETAAHRLRATRSLWDPEYVDESWIDEEIELIPRMQRLAEEYYPGTRFALTEWNFGADDTLNGALAIADVLGIFGRENLYMAAYWMAPELGSPGLEAFKMYMNYDGEGSKFGDLSVLARSTNLDVIASYAAIDSQTGDLHLMLINKLPDEALMPQIEIEGFIPSGVGEWYRYDGTQLDNIVSEAMNFDAANFEPTLPPYSINLFVLKSDS